MGRSNTCNNLYQVIDIAFILEDDYMKEESIPTVKASLLASPTVKFHELSVIIFTEPLISGKFLGKTLPTESTYLELWKTIDGVGYKAIGAKMSMLTEAGASELLDRLAVTGVKRKRMVRLNDRSAQQTKTCSTSTKRTPQ